MQPLAQPPRKEDGRFDDWMFRLWKRIASTAGLAWSMVDKTGSNLTDIETRNHADLQNINTASYTHLTSAEYTGTGTGNFVRETSPTLITPALGTPSSGTVTNLTGTASININGTVGATTPNTAKVTTLETTGTVGVGSASVGGIGIRVGGGALTLTGTNQSAISTNVIYDSTVVSPTAYSSAGTMDTATVTRFIHYSVGALTLTNGAVATDLYGFRVPAAMNNGTNNFAFDAGLVNASGRWNFYARGTANNAYAGNSRFGGLTAPTVAVDVTGAVLATTTILSSGATSGIGYSTGAGGTVTQATSRTTGVTLNKICGEITLVSAAGSTSWQSFTVTNSAVAATDNIVVNQKSGTDKNMIHVTAKAAGSFEITFATTGGTTTDQPVFSFAVIKGVAA